MKKLNGKKAVVTGGSSGIGLATARRFIAEGAQVIITGRRQDAIDQALTELGEQAIGVQGDVGNLADLDRLVAEAEARLGKIDIYCANAGVNALVPFDQVSESMFDQLFTTNVKGVFFGLQKALPIMNDDGAIILVGSIASSHVMDRHNVYAGTKAAIRAFARYWAMELRHRGIRVNVLSPGPVKTPIVDSLGLNAEQLSALDITIADMIPMGRWGTAEELANAALFLASSDSSFMTASELFVDGGLAQV
ncbi:SDR family oxidoreductase [Brucella pituitosa]|uniref:SDR family oxidoreductase n=1 Tax=Brucella pituitosa TaxID=571256 RepID=A0ABS3K0W8_9HYPH|nr:SDR family oxidoreductase [Brucella pituitosa]MBO1039980.1 SDR family oxidoreductase [Brucella pituitosa]